jgi:hypothetical protein
MLQALQILSLVLVALAMAFAVAHAAELPGKRRLDRDSYMIVQPIYYPGFTVGAFSEPGSILALAVLALVTPRDFPGFGWTLAALLLMLAMHLVYWTVTHPVNRFWLKDQRLSSAGRRFFGRGGEPPADWRAARDRWEYSHVARAALAFLAFVAVAIAATTPPPALAGLDHGV